MSKCKFYVGTNKVIAVSRYAGKSVKASSKCDPRDEFNLDKGKQLAEARCDAKVAEKRLARAREEYKKASDELRKAQFRLDKMKNYLADSIDAEVAAKNTVVDILENM